MSVEAPIRKAEVHVGLKEIWVKMRVRLTYLGPMRSAFGRDSEEISLQEEVRLRDLLHTLSERSGERLKLYVLGLSEAWAKIEGVPESLIEGDQWKVSVTVNDLPHYRLQGLDTPLRDGDKVAISLLFSGGG